MDAAGNLYIADTWNSRVRKVSNGVITTVAGSGTEGFSGDNGPNTSAQLAGPGGVAADSAGNLYIADTSNYRIRKVSNGVITTVAGSGAYGFSGDNGPATNAMLSGPGGITVDSAGNLYIADTGNSRIRKVSNGVITTVAGSGTYGLSGDNGPATSAELEDPYGVALDSAGNFYVADTNNSRIRRVSNGVITTVAGNGTGGFSGDNGPATSAELAIPYGVVVDSPGNVYIADTQNYRIRILTTAPAALPVVSATPTTMSFTYSVGGSNPPTQTVAVSGGGAAATFSVSTSSLGWLSVSPTSGTTPNTGTFNITVRANPTGLTVQTYNGSITIAGTGTATGSTIVNVTFAVSAPVPTITKVTNGASFATGAVSPGELISIFANTTNPIGPTPAVSLSSTTCPSPCTNVSTTMGGVQVEFLPQGVYAPLLYVSAMQINAVVPYEVQTAGGSVSAEVKYLGQASNAFILQTTTTAPGIFTTNGGTGTAAMNQYDASGNFQGQNSGSNPASPGWVLVLYVTGEGAIPAAVDGSVTSSITVKPLVGAPTVLIDNLPATVAYYGEAYGIVSGVMQVNVQIPTGIRTSQADTISLTIGGNTSQNGVTISVAPVTLSTPGNMAGSWQFTAQSSIFGLSFSVTGKIAQIENDVSGQLEITGTPCATSAAFNGTVSGTSALTMNLNENGQVVVFSGTLASDGNSASGTYSALSGGCTNGDKGTWSGQRVSTGN